MTAPRFPRIASVLDLARRAIVRADAWANYGWTNPPPQQDPAPHRVEAGTVKGYGDFPVNSISQWKIEEIKGALDAHELGNFMQSAMLADAMTRDDRYQATLTSRVNALLGAEFEMLPAVRGSNKSKARKVAREFAELWPQIITADVIAQLRRWDVQMGFAIAEIVWETSEDQWIPRIKVWHPQFSYYNLISRRFVMNTSEGPIQIQPGDGHWMIYSSAGLYRGWMSGSVRSLALPWIGRSLTFTAWGRWIEVHGMPWRKAIVPASASAPLKDSFWSSLVNIGREYVVECPTGMGPEGKQSFDVELVEAANYSAWEGFKEFRLECATSMAIAHCGQNLGTESHGGGLSKGDLQSEVKQDYLEADEQGLASFFQTQLGRPFAQYNYDDPTLSPLPSWKVKPPKDKAAEAQTFATVMTGIGTAALAGVPLDVVKVCDQFEVPVLGAGEPGAPPVPPPAAPPAPPPADPNAPPSDGAPPPEGPAPVGHQQVLRFAGERTHRTNAIAGQVFVDAVADQGRAQMARAMRTPLDGVLAAVRASKSYEDLRKRLPAVLRGMDTESSARIMESAIVLSRLAGRHAVKEDL